MKNIMFENTTQPFTIRMDASLSPTPHFHKDIEIVYVIDGDCEVFADRKKDRIKTGDIYISFPNQIHYYQGCKTGMYLLVILSPDIIFELKDVLYDNIPKSNVLHSVSDKRYVKLFKESLDTEGKYAPTLTVGLLNQSMAYMIPELELKPRIKTNNTTLQEVLNYCSSNFANNITLDDVAEQIHLSKYHISHLFNDKLGLSFNNYLNSLRINTACDLLEDTDKKMADISEEVGFGSIRSFNRAFQDTMNMSPLEYRNQFK